MKHRCAGERPAAFGEGFRSNSPSLSSAAISGRLYAFKWPDRAGPIDQIPHNSIGKADRIALAGRSRGTGAIGLLK